MKTKINEPKRNTFTDYRSLNALTQEKHESDDLLAKLLAELKIEQLLEERKKGNYTAFPKKQVKLVKRLNAVIHDAYGDTSELMRSVDEWIKLVSLNTEEENRIGNQAYSDLLFFLFTFKEVLKDSATCKNLINELLHFIYRLFGRRQLIEDIENWIRFVTLCTEKENYTGSEEHLDLLNFLFIFKDTLQKKKSP